MTERYIAMFAQPTSPAERKEMDGKILAAKCDLIDKFSENHPGKAYHFVSWADEETGSLMIELKPGHAPLN